MICSPELPFLCFELLKEAIFSCMVGLPLFGKEGSGTPVFKILLRALYRDVSRLSCRVKTRFLEDVFSFVTITII